MDNTFDLAISQWPRNSFISLGSSFKWDSQKESKVRHFVKYCPQTWNLLVFWITDRHIVYFRLGFSHRFTFPILVYTVWVVTGLVSSYSDIKWTPTGWASWLDILWQCFKLKLDIELLLIKNLTSSKYSDHGHILCSLLFQRSTKHIWPLWWYDDDDDWFASGLMITILERY